MIRVYWMMPACLRLAAFLSHFDGGIPDLEHSRSKND